MPDLPLTGGCQCGKVRYEIRAAPLMVYNCHCTTCQRISAGAFNISVAHPRRRHLDAQRACLGARPGYAPAIREAAGRLCPDRRSVSRPRPVPGLSVPSGQFRHVRPRLAAVPAVDPSVRRSSRGRVSGRASYPNTATVWRPIMTGSPMRFQRRMDWLE